MKNEELHMLKMQELCARLSFGVKVRGVFLNYNKDKDRILYEECDRELDWQDLRCIDSFKPYLRPLSSMTDEELKEFYIIEGLGKHPVAWNKPQYNWHFTVNGIDWLNAHHFDYRGLIEKGLALEAPKGMYK